MDFSDLYTRYAGDVHRFSLFRSGNKAVAEDRDLVRAEQRLVSAAIAAAFWIAFLVVLYRGRRNITVRLR